MATNPLLDEYEAIKSEQESRNILDGNVWNQVFHPDMDEDTRMAALEQVDDETADKYAWAIPDARALKIIQHFGPVYNFNVFIQNSFRVRLWRWGLERDTGPVCCVNRAWISCRTICRSTKAIRW